MKKIILLVALVFLLGLAVFVSAKMTFIDDYHDIYNIYKTEVVLEKGWNLVSFNAEGIEQDSEIKIKDIKAVYYYNPIENNYLLAYPNSDKFNELMNENSCGDGRCPIEERANYNSWCYKDCKFELNDDIVSNLNVISQKRLSLSKGEKAVINFAKHKNLEVYWDENSNSGSCVERGYANIDCVMLHFKAKYYGDYYDDREFINSPNDGNRNNDFFGNIILLSEEGKINIYAKVNYGTRGKYNIDFYEIEDYRLIDNSNQASEISIAEKILTQPAWVYSTKRGLLKLSKVPSITLRQNKLKTGWNFINIIPDFEGKSFNSLKGNCNVIKVAGWDTGTLQWDLLTEKQLNKKLFYENTILEPGKGLVIKVSKNCVLGEIISPPPALPNGSTPTIDQEFIKYPKEISNYQLYGNPKVEKNCDYFDPEGSSDTKGLGLLSGEICSKTLRLKYRDANSDKGVFVIPMKITKGKEIYDKYLEVKASLSETGINGVKRLEDHELFWFYGDNYLIATQEFTQIKHPDRSIRYNYGTATGDNPATKWFLANYPPVK